MRHPGLEEGAVRPIVICQQNPPWPAGSAVCTEVLLLWQTEQNFSWAAVDEDILKLQSECTMLEQQYSLLFEVALFCLLSFRPLLAGCLQVADLICQYLCSEGALLQQPMQCLTRLCCCMWVSKVVT